MSDIKTTLELFKEMMSGKVTLGHAIAVRLRGKVFVFRNKKKSRRNSKVKLGKLIEVYPGGRHAYYESTVGRVRKPLNHNTPIL